MAITTNRGTLPMNDIPQNAETSTAAEMEAHLTRLIGRQNLTLAVFAGICAMLVGTALWVVVTVVTNYQIGYMAVGVGLLVGFAMKYAGGGVQPHFGYIGAGLSLLGCLLGNLFTACQFLAVHEKVTFGEVVAALNPEFAYALMSATFSPMDLLFYGLAIWAGYKYSFTPISI